ncbi:MAG: putative toxin-antitoxin system toxin component, PIN family [Oscillospiraceae bacterium]|jgi:putative PIN family toxin of toxin-antitoxin system|nr:putative toxin-antitoxin system toxin component, PIN family [Oscillospiraceae bacterium]
MIVLIDTNILISAAYSVGSTPHRAFRKAVQSPFQALVCEQSLVELRRTANRKFSDRIHIFNDFIAGMLLVVKVVPVPELTYSEEEKIRDLSDRPILRTAIKEGADILLTGDKDFLESSVISPQIMTAAAFMTI